MGKHVIGVYESEEAVVSAVQQLQLRGYDTDEISVVTNHDHYTDTVETITGATVDNVEEPHKESFLDKLKAAFMDDEYTNSKNSLGERLSDYGIPDREAASYASDVESGKILLMVDSDRDLATDESDALNPTNAGIDYGTFRIATDVEDTRDGYTAGNTTDNNHRDRDFRRDADVMDNTERPLRANSYLTDDTDRELYPDEDVRNEADRDFRDRTRRTPRNSDEDKLF
ncbi:general stress protein [Fictibacillus sp. WQ 8-8]|uniref:general stress protein n=1 Tax=Fictibacillus sp. WQ 8-8 TaxID=2938788 RepID=UPI002108BF1F|nr:general stress protein [Fictibacillus sp. WQ 8-8]MCQ6265115.1 general stress protein [Fictibacillus sp. WQ 8-8]